jgi:hypothetical protein
MNRNFVLGCGGVIVVLVILVGVLILETPKFLEEGKALVKRTIAEEQRIAELEAAWQPPSAAVDGQWLPENVGTWRLERSVPEARIPELNIDRAGQHGSYRSSAGTLEVDIVPASDLEKRTLIERASDALSVQRQVMASQSAGVEVSINRGAARLTTTRGDRTHLRIGSDEHARFWWVKGWLFIFRARGVADSETFPEEYLRALLPIAPAAEVKVEKN